MPSTDPGQPTATSPQAADALDALPTPDLEAAVSAAAETVAAAEPGDGPTTLTPRVPVVAVTGTNGKTTTSRMIAHIARAHGLLTGWSNTDGIYIDGELVESATSDFIDLVDPVTGEVDGRSPVSTPDEVDRAYAAALRASESWKRLTPGRRQAYLRICWRSVCRDSSASKRSFIASRSLPVHSYQGRSAY